jgi:hypothetical protein
MALQARDATLRHGVVRPALTCFSLMLNELGGAVGGGGSARNAEVEFGPYTSVLSKATALDVAKLAGSLPRRVLGDYSSRPSGRRCSRGSDFAPRLGRSILPRMGDLSWRAIRHVSRLSIDERRDLLRDLTAPSIIRADAIRRFRERTGRTKNGPSPDGLGGGRASPASSDRCTSSFACIAWMPKGAIGVAKECSDA